MGVSVEGSVLVAREKVNQEFYGLKDVKVGDILSGEITPPLAAFPLYETLGEVMREGEGEGGGGGGREGGREACSMRSDSRYGMHGRHWSKTGWEGGGKGRREEEVEGEEEEVEEVEVGGLLRGTGGEMMTFRVTEE